MIVAHFHTVDRALHGRLVTAQLDEKLMLYPTPVGFDDDEKADWEYWGRVTPADCAFPDYSLICTDEKRQGLHCGCAWKIPDTGDILVYFDEPILPAPLLMTAYPRAAGEYDLIWDRCAKLDYPR